MVSNTNITPKIREPYAQQPADNQLIKHYACCIRTAGISVIFLCIKDIRIATGRLWHMTYNPEHFGGYISRPLCHLYTYNRHSGSLKPHFSAIPATTVSHLSAKTSQWSRQNNQKCSDARIWCKKLASGRISVADGGILCSDARICCEKLASRTITVADGGILCCDAGKRSEKLASRGVDKGNDMN